MTSDCSKVVSQRGPFESEPYNTLRGSITRLSFCFCGNVSKARINNSFLESPYLVKVLCRVEPVLGKLYGPFHAVSSINELEVQRLGLT